MKNNALIFFILLLFIISCNKQDPKDQIPLIEGYWEINKVEVSPDSTITYQVNQNIDHFEIDGSKGIRNKVQPQLDGSYKTSNSAEKIELKIEEDSLRIYYKTAYDNWKETVLKASEEKLVVKNEQNKIYHYKKYRPINIEKNEEK